MLVNVSKKFIFFHNPKTAGMFVRDWILQNKGQDRIISFFGFSHKKKFDKAHINQNMVQEYIDFNTSDYYKFCVIRDPYDRLRSAYEWAANNNYSGSKTYLKEKKINTLEDMLAYLNNHPDEIHNYILPWFMPQYIYIYKDNARNIDFIIDFQDLGDGLSFIGNRFGFWRKARVNKKKLKRKPLLSKLHKEITEKLYADDFNYLNLKKRETTSRQTHSFFKWR